MSHPHEPEPLRPMLEAAQSDLAKALDEACAHDDLDEESTAQLMRLEESLSEAAQAAKQAVSLRRRLRTDRQIDATESDRAEAEAESDRTVTRPPTIERRSSGSPTGSDAPSSVREFRDARGVLWRAWAVMPAQIHPDRPLDNRLGEYTNGWLAFESEDGSQRRRLPHHPEDWAHRTNHALEMLLESAEPVRTRRRTAADDTDTPPA
jgi:hypothetical protein